MDEIMDNWRILSALQRITTVLHFTSWLIALPHLHDWTDRLPDSMKIQMLIVVKKSELRWLVRMLAQHLTLKCQTQ